RSDRIRSGPAASLLLTECGIGSRRGPIETHRAGVHHIGRVFIQSKGIYVIEWIRSDLTARKEPGSLLGRSGSGLDMPVHTPLDPFVRARPVILRRLSLLLLLAACSVVPEMGTSHPSRSQGEACCIQRMAVQRLVLPTPSNPRFQSISPFSPWRYRLKTVL